MVTSGLVKGLEALKVVVGTAKGDAVDKRDALNGEVDDITVEVDVDTNETRAVDGMTVDIDTSMDAGVNATVDADTTVDIDITVDVDTFVDIDTTVDVDTIIGVDTDANESGEVDVITLDVGTDTGESRVDDITVEFDTGGNKSREVRVV